MSWNTDCQIGKNSPVTDPALWFEQARGRERPVIDLPDDLLLAGVVLHDVLPGRGGLGRGLALGGSVAIALAGVAAVGKARRARVNRPGSRF